MSMKQCFCFVLMRDTRGRWWAGGLDLKPENLGTTVKQFFCVKNLSLKPDDLRIVDSLLTDRLDGLQDFVSSVIIGSLALDPETCFDYISIVIVELKCLCETTEVSVQEFLQRSAYYFSFWVFWGFFLLQCAYEMCHCHFVVFVVIDATWAGLKIKSDFVNVFTFLHL